MRICIIAVLLVPAVWADEFTGMASHSRLLNCREAAITDVIKQIGRSIGAEYDLRVSSHMTMTTRKFDHRFQYQASGWVEDLDRYVVGSRYQPTSSGYECWVMVDYPDSAIKRMRRINRGARVVCKPSGSGFTCREINGVRVVLSEAVVSVTEVHRHAGFLDYYVMETASGDRYERRFPLGVELSGKWHKLPVSVPRFSKVKDLVYGTDRKVKVRFIGVDETGKAIEISLQISNRD